MPDAVALRREVAFVGLAVVGVSVASLAAVGGLLPAAIVAGVAAAAGFAVLARRRPGVACAALLVTVVVQTTIDRLTDPTSSVARLSALAEDAMLVVLLATALTGGRRRAVPAWLGVPAAVYAAAGVISGLLAGAPLDRIALGGWAGLRLVVTVVVVHGLVDSRNDVTTIVTSFLFAGVTSVAVAAVEVLDRSPFGLPALEPAPTAIDQRRGLLSLFNHPSEAGVFLTVVALVALAAHLHRATPLRLGVAIAAFGTAVLTLRLRVFVAATVGLAVLTWWRPHQLVRRAAFAIGIGVAVAGVLGAAQYEHTANQVERWLGSSENTPRVKLYEASVAIATDRFPLGVGFGQFGSGPSADQGYYSPVFVEYGLADEPGLTPAAPFAAHDTTWPTALGETGVVGGIAFAVVVAALLTRLLALARVRTDPVPAAAAAALAALAVESLASPFLFHPIGAVPVGILVGAALSSAGSEAEDRSRAALAST